MAEIKKMNTEEARKKLEASRELLREQSKLHAKMENEEEEKISKIFGPRNDLEYQKMLNEIKESENDK